MSRKRINKFMLEVEKILKSEFPGRQVFTAFHPVGDKSSDYHPHCDCNVIERLNIPGGVKMKLNRERLDKVKSAFVASLNRLGCVIDDAVVYYGFTLTKGRFLHSVKYMSRPCPDYEQRRKIETENPDLFQFLESDEMKGFKFVRKLRVKVDQDQFIEGEKIPKQEKMKFVERVGFNWNKFVDQYRLYERHEVFPGRWAIREGGFTKADKLRLGLDL